MGREANTVARMGAQEVPLRVHLDSERIELRGSLRADLTFAELGDVRVEGETDVYIWGDKSLRLHRCKICGNVSHWSPIDPALERMGVNTRLMPREIWTAARVRKFDGADTWEEIG